MRREFRVEYCCPAPSSAACGGSFPQGDAFPANFLDIPCASEYNIKIGLTGAPGRLERRKLFPAKTAAFYAVCKKRTFL